MVPGVWAVNAHLPYLLASPKYQVVAVSNSSKESASASIKANNLGDDVKAYGSAQEIANDPNVDLVVVSVRIAHHYDLAKPALEAGKEVFVEWPLGATTAQAVELAELAKSKGVKTMVGLQARASPLVIKLKEIIESGKIGNVLSSTVNANFMQTYGKWPGGAEYYLDKDSGANQFVVFFGHCKPLFSVHISKNII
jgi:predicted dehydrogenase